MTPRLPWLALALFMAAGSGATGLDTPADLKPVNVEVTAAAYRGLSATLFAAGSWPVPPAGTESLALVPGPAFENGWIEVDVAGLLDETARADARGFIGLAFDVTGTGDRFKAFYIRPTNGRAADQLRRNHSTQYVSMPEFPWDRLRQEEPGVYESYVDLDAKAWTHLRVQVDGDKASL